MHWFTAFVLYVMIWWTLLFAILPVGTKPVADADTATGWRGAPARPMIGRKVLATTLLSLLVWGVAMLIINSGWISFRTGWLALPEN